MPATPFEDIFQQFAALLLLAAVIGYAGQRLRQPLIVSFIVVGIVAGPAVLGWVEESAPVRLLADMGIALLLFVVGLKLDLHLIRTMGPVALATGLGQVVFTSVVGYLLGLALGLSHTAAIYVAVALTFSSTIIIVKLLSDKREIDALHGRIAVGFLIVQDLVVVLVMIALSAFGAGSGETHLLRETGLVLIKGIALLLGVAALTRYVLPQVLGRLAQSQELLILFAIALAVAMGAAGDLLGFSKEVGAFLAGVALASTPYREAIGARLVTLRDFLLVFFFLALGATLEMDTLGAQLGPAAVLSLFVLIGNPLIVMIIMGAMGYRKRTGFLAGLTVAQISEFSLILAALGFNLGHIDEQTVGLITVVGLITIGTSTYMILYSHHLYRVLAPALSVFERRLPYRELSLDGAEGPARTDVILFGLGRFGNRLAQRLRREGYQVLGVDFDPQAVSDWREQGFAAQYGDAEDPEFHATLPLHQAQWVVSSIPHRDVNLLLLHSLPNHGFGGRTALAAHNAHDARRLEAAGASLVLLPFADAADQAVDRLLAAQDAGQADAAQA